MFFDNGIYPFFRTSDVGRIHIGRISKSSDMLNNDGIKGMTLCKKGTILFPKSGASTFLNHRVIMDVDGFVSSHLATIKAKESIILSGYLFQFLKTVDAKELMQDQNYPSLRLSDISNILIFYPNNINDQQKIVAKLDKISEKTKKLESVYQKKLNNLEELKKSALYKAFSGGF